MITQDRLKEVLHYDPLTGAFTWLAVVCVRMRVGSSAGTDCRGYKRIKIDGRSYFSHRLAWLYMNGRLPEGQVDHKDGDRSNNRFDNLRLASHGQNQANKPVQCNSLSGRKGVNVRPGGRYQARIQINGKCISLGYYDDIESAAKAYDEAAVKYFGEYALTNSMIA